MLDIIAPACMRYVRKSPTQQFGQYINMLTHAEDSFFFLLKTYLGGCKFPLLFLAQATKVFQKAISVNAMLSRPCRVPLDYGPQLSRLWSKLNKWNTLEQYQANTVNTNSVFYGAKTETYLSSGELNVKRPLNLQLKVIWGEIRFESFHISWFNVVRLVPFERRILQFRHGRGSILLGELGYLRRLPFFYSVYWKKNIVVGGGNVRYKNLCKLWN